MRVKVWVPEPDHGHVTVVVEVPEIRVNSYRVADLLLEVRRRLGREDLEHLCFDTDPPSPLVCLESGSLVSQVVKPGELLCALPGGFVDLEGSPAAAPPEPAAAAEPVPQQESHDPVVVTAVARAAGRTLMAGIYRILQERFKEGKGALALARLPEVFCVRWRVRFDLRPAQEPDLETLLQKWPNMVEVFNVNGVTRVQLARRAADKLKGTPAPSGAAASGGTGAPALEMRQLPVQPRDTGRRQGCEEVAAPEHQPRVAAGAPLSGGRTSPSRAQVERPGVEEPSRQGSRVEPKALGAPGGAAARQPLLRLVSVEPRRPRARRRRVSTSPSGSRPRSRGAGQPAPVQEVRCPAGHALGLYSSAPGQQECDRCRAWIYDAVFRRCRDCDFDLCGACFRSLERRTSEGGAGGSPEVDVSAGDHRRLTPAPSPPPPPQPASRRKGSKGSHPAVVESREVPRQRRRAREEEASAKEQSKKGKRGRGPRAP